MAVLNYDVTKALSNRTALAVGNFIEALADLKRVSADALATASAAGDAGLDATWAIIEGSNSEYGVVAGGSAGANGHAWFTAVDTLAALADNSAVKDAVQKLDKGA